MRTIACLVIATLLAGCATRGANYAPLVDTKGKDQATYANDLSECQQFARQRADAAHGAVAGAVVAGLLGAFLAPRGYRNELAVRAAGIGALGGAAQAGDTQENIIRACLAGRGHSVLN